MRRCLCVALLLLAPPVARAADAPVVGFLRVDADKYFAEEQKHDPFAKRVLAIFAETVYSRQYYFINPMQGLPYPQSPTAKLKVTRAPSQNLP